MGKRSRRRSGGKVPAKRGEERPAVPFDDLNFMIGSMGSAEARTIEDAIAHQRTVDPKLWA